jgi:iron complex transport system substrate-binding protein
MRLFGGERVQAVMETLKIDEDQPIETKMLTNSIEGVDYEFTYTAAPRRIVTVASPATEMLLALGLQDSIVGYAYQENVIPEKYAEVFNALPCISDGWEISRELILACEPDFMMFWNGDPLGSYEFLSANNISTYTLTSDQDGATIESVYADFRAMGRIFGIEDRAEAVIADMQAKIEEAKVETDTPVSVVYIDPYSSESSCFTAGNALVADVFRMAGGENIINDTTDPWLNVSWETVAAANPDYIVLGEYDGVDSTETWMEFLKTNPATATMDAVVNGRIIVVGLADLTIGERIANTVAVLAEGFRK